MSYSINFNESDTTGATAMDHVARAKKATPPELADKPLSPDEVEKIIWEIKRQPSWREEANRCADYVDGNQLTREMVETLRERGQPDIIVNLIKPTIDAVLGIEAQNRTDWIIRPDDESCSDDLAAALSLKLKHAEVESLADRACSDAYEDQIKTGLGWVEVAHHHDVCSYPYRCQRIHRREIYWDWRSELPDLTDASYLIRRKWYPAEEVIARMPRHADLLREAVSGWHNNEEHLEAETGLMQSRRLERDTRLEEWDWRDTTREMICLYEIWYRKWVSGFILRFPGGKRVPFNEQNEKHVEAVLSQSVPVERGVFPRVRLAWYAGRHYLYDVPSPYDHKYFPYIPFFGYREDLTGAPYGIVRAMISPQDEINARKSKLLWLLNTRRVIMDSDAVADIDLMAQEVARADAIIELNPHRRPDARFEIETTSNLAPQQYEALLEAKQNIAEASGIHKTMMGEATQARSGLAINSLAEQGAKSIAAINDNYRFARRLVGEALFSLLKQDLTGRPIPVKLKKGRNERVIVLNQPVAPPNPVAPPPPMMPPGAGNVGAGQQPAAAPPPTMPPGAGNTAPLPPLGGGAGGEGLEGNVGAGNMGAGQPTIENDVSQVKVKVALDDMPSTPTYRMQQLSMLTEVAKSMPENLQGAIIDFIIEATDLPDKTEIADRLRAMMNLPTPEGQEQREQQQAQEQAALKEKEAKAFALEAALKLAEIRRTNAEADRAVTQSRFPNSYQKR